MKRVSLFSWQRYIIFFLFTAGVVTASIILLLTSMPIDEATLRHNAPLTMGNVLFMSLLITVGDGIYRKITIERRVKQILAATDSLAEGDYTARVPVKHKENRMNELDSISAGINTLAAELAGVETLRTDFVANVSHELKTPLAVIQNYATLLQGPELGEEDRLEYAKAITASSRRLAALIANILKLNKLENQQIFPEVKSFDLSESLCETLLQFESVWEEKNIDIETDIEDGVTVEDDAELLGLVWSNLFSNAFKFTGAGGKVGVSLHRDGENAVVTVSDTGCGMPEETVKHIFDKFYQGDTSHALEGNGLGLALAKRVVDIHGGTIEVRSEPGRGSVFTVKI